MIYRWPHEVAKLSSFAIGKESNAPTEAKGDTTINQTKQSWRTTTTTLPQTPATTLRITVQLPLQKRFLNVS